MSPSPAMPLQSFWGGYRVRPVEMEIWQGRTSRLHDRFLYSRSPGGALKFNRLAPWRSDLPGVASNSACDSRDSSFRPG